MREEGVKEHVSEAADDAHAQQHSLGLKAGGAREFAVAAWIGPDCKAEEG